MEDVMIDENRIEALNSLIKYRNKNTYLAIMTELIPGLYVGGLSAAFDEKQLIENKIRAIVSIRSHPDGYKFSPDFSVLHLTLQDIYSQKIIDQFQHSNSFIHSHRLKKENVLVHCLVGVSRSVCICAAYLMTVTNLNYLGGTHFIKNRRLWAWPNNGFMTQLKEFGGGKVGGGKLLLEERKRLYEEFSENQSADFIELRKEDCQFVKCLKNETNNNPLFPHFEKEEIEIEELSDILKIKE